MAARSRWRWAAVLAAAVVPVLALAAGPDFGFGPPPAGGPNMAPRGGPGFGPPGGPGGPACLPGTAPAGATAAVEQSPDPPVGLRLVREVDVTPAPLGGAPCVRPELVRSGASLYVAYMEAGPTRSNRLLQLDADLKPVRVFALALGAGQPTDMRWVGDADGTLWCAFETAEGDERSPVMTLNLASYRPSAAGLTPVALERGVARGAMIAPPWSIPAPGAEITDDPTPFPYEGALVVGTRRFEQAVLPLRRYRAGATPPAPFDLDLSSLFPDRSLSVYSLVSIEGRPWLVGGAVTSPRATTPAGDIYAVPLQKDLRQADGKAVPLVATPAYETYVSGARYAAGRLALVHLVHDQTPPGRFEGYLRVFDAARGFAPLGHAQINIVAGNRQVDDHLSVEIVDDRILVAYYTPQGRLIVREYAVAR
jgi:hypothetical protein